MKKSILKIITIILILTISIIGLTACSNETQNSTNNTEEIQNAAKHYEISLNMDNFNDFIIVRYIPGSDERKNVIIEGVLDFAYYEGVVIEFERYVEAEGKTALAGTFEICLNAAGDKDVYIDYIENTVVGDLLGLSWVTGHYENYKIINVKGKVCFTA